MRHPRCLAAALIGLGLSSAVPAFAQFVQQGPKVVGTGGILAQQGNAVGISADGNTAVVAGFSDDTLTGAIWVFARSGGAWTQQGAKLVGTGSVGTGGAQGWSVALSGDGSTALVGAQHDNNGVGAAWVFTRAGSTWTQLGSKMLGAEPCDDYCFRGSAVALSSDGKTALIGASGEGATGAAWVFSRIGTTWTQEAMLAGTGGVGGPQYQGTSVALSADGNTALVGGPGDDSSTGAVWVFTRTGTTWTQQGDKLKFDATTGLAGFGFSVTLSADGNTAVASSLFGMRAFTRSGSTWTANPNLVGGTAFAGGFLSLSGDANVLLVGYPGDESEPNPLGFRYPPVSKGASFAFRRVGGEWLQIGTKFRGTDAVFAPTMGVRQGASVALAFDGRTAIAGAPYDDSGVGAAWIFTLANDALRAGDADGDARSDITVYNTTSGVWSSLTSASGFTGATNVGWGGTGYSPVAGDYDGNGQADLGVYQESSGNWYVLFTGTYPSTALSKSVGGPGWTPVPGDYDGDGKTDFVVYNTSTGQWYGLKSGSGYTTTVNISFGGAGYQAVPGDFDSDGRADIGVYQIATGNWYVLLSSNDYITSLSINAGGSGYVPVQADYDGDGKTDFAVYNVTSGLWYALKSSTSYTTTLSVGWGGTGYAPVKGDYDGDGRADLAVYQASSGNWYILLSSANCTTTLTKSWGGAGYAAVPQ